LIPARLEGVGQCRENARASKPPLIIPGANGHVNMRKRREFCGQRGTVIIPESLCPECGGVTVSYFELGQGTHEPTSALAEYCNDRPRGIASPVGFGRKLKRTEL